MQSLFEILFKEGIGIFTPNDYSQQVGYMKRPKGYHIKPHLHHHVPRRVSNTQEVNSERGKVRVDFTMLKKYLMSENLLKEILLYLSVGHGFFMEKESELIEVKQGPYLGEKDKERFDSISNDMVIMEKD